jgi:hypothetical protein
VTVGGVVKKMLATPLPGVEPRLLPRKSSVFPFLRSTAEEKVRVVG